MSGAYSADVYYTASGYPNAPELNCDALIVFYISADSFGEAVEKVIENFRAFEKVKTGATGTHTGLSYHLNGVRVEKAV